MAKKIRFPLEMENGIEVRSMEELRNNVALGRVLEYVQNEKLVIWLRDRYENNIADTIAELDNERALLDFTVVPYARDTISNEVVLILLPIGIFVHCILV